MALIGAVAQDCKLDEPTASKALGAVFTSIRMSVDTRTFSLVAAAFPDCSTWMRAVPATTGRTGAMLALATPNTLERSLQQMGMDREQIAMLGTVVGQALGEQLPEDAVGSITKKLPLIQT